MSRQSLINSPVALSRSLGWATTSSRSSRRRELCVDPLESRRLLTAFPTTAAAPADAESRGFVYVQSNNHNAGENAVLAYQRDDDELEFVAAYPTGGTGFLNADDRLGPNDNDRPVIVNSSRTLLFSVDGASNRITSFRINEDGSLTRLARIRSEGFHPVSLEIAGRTLYVLNKGNVGPFDTGAALAPNISIFRIASNGSLRLVQAAAVTYTTAPGSTPSQLLSSPDDRFIFADRLFIDPPGAAPSGETRQLDSFSVDAVTGQLTRAAAPAGPNNLPPGAPASLEGISVNPTQRIIYSGLPLANGIAVFTYNTRGKLTYFGSQPTSVVEPCWTLIDPTGNFLYATNSQSNTVTVFSLADPLRPVQIQAIVLAPPRQDPTDGVGRFNSLPHQFSLDPEGRRLYVLNQKRSATDSFPDGNNLHILDIDDDGTVSENRDPLIFSQTLVPADGRPQGVVAI